MEHVRLTSVSASDYLAVEHAGGARHEFVAGHVFTREGARDVHNTIALNVALHLRKTLRSESHRVFMSEIVLHVAGADAYYYPDVFVTCDARDTDPYIKRYPTLVIEVLSPRTEGVDRREKLRNYRMLETLKEYAIIAVDEARVEIYRLEPGSEWHHYVYGSDEIVELSSVNIKLPLGEIYEGVVLP